MAVEMKQKRAQWKKEKEEEEDQEVEKGKILEKIDKVPENRSKEAEDSQIPQLDPDELLEPDIHKGEDEENVEEIELLGLDRSWCMTCVHWPCLCALTKLEMRITALRANFLAQEVEKEKEEEGKEETLIVEEGEVGGGL